MDEPRAETIARSGRGTASPRSSDGTAVWTDVAALLRTAPGTTWLSVRREDGGVHTRPLFAAWSGESFVFASKGSAAKTRHLERDGAVSLAVDLGTLHLVVEGTARRLTTPDDLARASATLLAVHDWPTEIVGDELDAPYAAPTSGGPPFQAWELTPSVVIALPTEDQVDPTRFVFD